MVRRARSQAGKNSGSKFDAANTVMVDDTPSKLRAQPYSLIAAPSYTYPFGPGSILTSRSLWDQFLLSLVGMLDALAAESNFAGYIKEMRWYEKDDGTNEVQSPGELRRRRNEGLDVLKRAGVPVEAEGRGLVPGVQGTESEPKGIRTAPLVTKGASEGAWADRLARGLTFCQLCGLGQLPPSFARVRPLLRPSLRHRLGLVLLRRPVPRAA